MRRLRIRNAALVAAMARVGFNNLHLAQASGITPGSVSAIINQRRDPTADTARAIAEVLNAKPGDLWPDLRFEEVRRQKRGRATR